MKKTLLIAFLSISFSAVAQTIVGTERNQRSIWYSNGLATLDNQTAPFTGTFIQLDSKEDTIKEYSYLNGKKHGKFYEWNKYSGAQILIKSGEYKNGLPIGNFVENYSYGRPEKRYSYLNGKLHGHFIAYNAFKDSLIDTEGWYVNGNTDSTWTYYYGGKLRTIENWKLGKRDGLKQKFNEDGILEDEEMYVKGKKEGEAKSYYQNGKLYLSAIYKDDKLNGPRVFYYKNGQIQKSEQYVNGDKKGLFIWYKEDGTKVEEATF